MSRNPLITILSPLPPRYYADHSAAVRGADPRATSERSDVSAAQPADRLAARTLAEDKIEGVFTRLLPAEVDLALLFHLMTLRGWTRDRARIVLDKAGWSV